MERIWKIICVYIYNWITLLCTWNTVSQLYFNKIHILRKNIICIWKEKSKTLCGFENPSIYATVETVADFMFWGSKIPADGDCSHEIKRHLLLGRTVMTNLDSILKSRGITLPTKVHLVKAVVFPVVMYGC